MTDQPTPLSDLLSAPSVFLLGPSGTGKTDVLGELALHVDKLFVIVTEPNGLETLLDSFARRKVPIDKLHFHCITPTRANFKELQDQVERVSRSTHDALTKQSPGSRQGAKMIDVMGVFHNFVCQRTGKAFGSLDLLPPTSAVAVDSLSGLTMMAWDVTMGNKLTAHPGEWGIGMKLIENAVNSWTSNLKCLFVLTAHLERETDEITQGTKLMPSTMGKKLAPKLPRFFSEIVECYCDGPKFFWRTSSPFIDLKHRALPLSSQLEPSFRPIVQAYNKRLAIMSNTKATS
jgi:hypothetical protein